MTVKGLLVLGHWVIQMACYVDRRGHTSEGRTEKSCSYRLYSEPISK